MDFAAFQPVEGEPLILRALLDRSVLEVFVGDSLCLTKRIYPTRPDSLGIRFFASGGQATLQRCACWPMGR